MIPFLSEQLRRNPYPFYEEMRNTSPVLHVPEANLWMVFDYDGVKRAISDHEAFSSSMSTARRPNPPWLIFFDPPHHTKLRALAARAFSPEVVARTEPRIREIARDLLHPMIERGEMDVAADYSIPLPVQVIADLIGIPAADWPHFRRWSDLILQLSYTLADPE